MLQFFNCSSITSPEELQCDCSYFYNYHSILVVTTSRLQKWNNYRIQIVLQKGGSAGAATPLTMNNGTALSRDVAGLDIYTEYEFEVLAFTSVGDGPRSSPVVVVRTMKRGKNFKKMFNLYCYCLILHLQ